MINRDKYMSNSLLGQLGSFIGNFEVTLEHRVDIYYDFIVNLTPEKSLERLQLAFGD